MERKSGVLMHVSSLFGKYSSGSFGEEAKYFVDFLADCGFSYWQVLPFCMTDEYNSPYKSYSSFSGNPYFVDLPTLYEKGLLTAEELKAAEQSSPYLCEFDRLQEERFELLKAASKRVLDKAPIKTFIENSPYLDAFCRFMALREANSGTPWQTWTVETPDESILFAWQFIQYEFFAQWQEIRRYANGKGIKLIGDIPIYVALDSADVWSAPDQFQLDKKQNPTHVAGVSPDYFSADGQLWGNPLYNWKAMKQDGYRWWCDRIRHMATMFDTVRIDHFRAFASYWSIPASSETAKAGKWIKGPGLPFIKAIKAAAGKTEIIAEDLGDITPDVYKLVQDSGFPGMKVFQFGFLSDDNSTHLPHNYPANAVAYTGTHDNDTLRGWLAHASPRERQKAMTYLQAERGEELPRKMMLAALASVCDTCILPLQDILGLSSEARINIPSTLGGNWQWRATALPDPRTAADLKYYTTLYERL